MPDQNLKERLKNIRANAYEAPSDAWELICRMLEPHWLGHPDPYVRDTLVYPTLATWTARGVLSADQTRTVLGWLTDDDHLFFRLGEAGTEAVLVRSFAALQIAAVLERHLHHPFLTAREVRGLVSVLRRYVEGENDLRGYDISLGWLHAAAHAADAMGNLARCAELGSAELYEVLEGLRLLAGCEFQAYTDGEDERLAAAMSQALLRPELALDERFGWLEGFREQVQTCAELEMPAGYVRFMNIKHTLRALYFLILLEPEGQRLNRRLEGLLHEFAEL